MNNGGSCLRDSWIKNSNVTVLFFILLGACWFLSLLLKVVFLQASEPLIYILTASKAERKKLLPANFKCKNSREGL